MPRELCAYIVYKDNQPVKQMALPSGKGRDYCNKLSKTYPNQNWSIKRRFYPCETD